MSLSSALFICIDAGGTKTASAICDDSGTILARGTGGSANMSEIGIDRSAEHIISAAREAINQLPDQPKDVVLAKAWVGIAGCDTVKDANNISARLAEFFTCPLSVTNDGLLLSSPLITRGSSWGVAVVAGTGSVVLGIKIDSRGEATSICRRGGQGHMYGDYGSAYQLGLMATKLSADDWDFGLDRPGGLADRVKEYWNVELVGDAPTKSAELDRNTDPITASNGRKLRIAGLAPAVVECASAAPPCPLALRVLRYCANSIAKDIADVVIQALRKGCEEVKQATLSVTGGAISQSIYRQAILEELKGMGIEFGHVEVLADAAGAGANALAGRPQE